MIKICDCSNKGQDNLHGNGRRVHNETRKESGDKKVYRCSVCNKESTK